MSDPQAPAAVPDVAGAVPVTPAADVTPVAAQTAVVTATVPAPAKTKRRAMGVTALVFALLALVTDVVTLVFGASSMTVFSDGNWGRGLGLLAGFVGFGILAVILGAMFAGIALVLGIGAMIGGSGRATGVIAFLLSLGELVLHGIVIAAMIGLVTTVPSAMGGVNGLESLPLDQLIPGLEQISPSPTA